MLKDLYSKLEGTTVAQGTQTLAAAIQKDAGFPVPDEVALVAALGLTAEIHMNLSPISVLAKTSREMAETWNQLTTVFLVALHAVGVSHGLTADQVDHIAHIGEQAAVADLIARAAEFDALHAIPQTSLQ